MSLSSYVINNMSIIGLLNYLKNANNSIALLENTLSHSIRIRPVIKSRTVKLVENIMELREALETLYDENKMKRLKEMLIDLLNSDFDNNFVKNMRLILNDYIHPTVLVAYAEIKLNELDRTGPELLLQALMAKNLANKANNMRNMIDSIDPAIIDRTTLDVYDIRQHEEMVKKYIAQSSALLHGLDDKRLSSINKAGQIIKRRIRKTKRRNINSRRRKYKRNKSRRSTH